MSSSVSFRAAVLLPLIFAMWLCCCEARAVPAFPFDALFSLFDPSAFINGTEQLEQFFATHAQHSIASLGELANIGESFLQGK